MSCAAALCALLDISGTHVTLGPTDHPHAEAQVTMRNAMQNSDTDDATYTLVWGDMVVQARFEWDRGPYGADRLTITPPDGMVCEPRDCIMTVPEMDLGTVYLIPWEGM